MAVSFSSSFFLCLVPPLMMDESGEWHKSKRPRNETVLKGVDARDGVYKSSFHGIGGLNSGRDATEGTDGVCGDSCVCILVV